MVPRAFSAERLAGHMRFHVALAAEIAGWVRAEPGWEVAAPHPPVCFRETPAGTSEAEREAIYALVLQEANATGGRSSRTPDSASGTCYRWRSGKSGKRIGTLRARELQRIAATSAGVTARQAARSAV